MALQEHFGDFDFFSGWAEDVDARAAQAAIERQAKEKTRIVEDDTPPVRPVLRVTRQVDLFDDLGDLFGTDPDPAPVTPAPSVFEPADEAVPAMAEQAAWAAEDPSNVLVDPEDGADSDFASDVLSDEDLAQIRGEAPDQARALAPEEDFDAAAAPAAEPSQPPDHDVPVIDEAPERVAVDALDDDVAERIEAGRAEVQRRAGEPALGAFIPVEDFRLTADLLDESRPPRVKAQDNIRAIEIAKSVTMAGRPATQEEKEALARYTGWGGLQYAFYDIEGKTKDGWESIASQLQSILTPDEYARARSTILDAHYTAENVVTAMWTGLRRVGYTGGQMMEPAGGAGNFLGLQPADLAQASQRTMVEIDPATAMIAKILYPKSRVIHAPFEVVSTGKREFDLFVGNPPFGDTRINDRRGESDPTRTRLSTNDVTNTHSYFFARAAEGLRAGGVAAFVVSRYLLDASTLPATEFRRSLARTMDLVEAVRLPDSAFSQNAGTEVVTDVIFLQKRAEPRTDEEIDALPWIVSRDVRNPDAKTADAYPVIRMNGWYAQHPDKVLGRLHAGRGMYRDGELMVGPTPDWKERLDAAMQALPADIMPSPASSQTSEAQQTQWADVRIPLTVRPGQMFVANDEEGKPGVYRRSVLDDMDGPRAERVDLASDLDRDRVIAMLDMADLLRDLIARQISPVSSDEAVESLRKSLAGSYDAFVKTHGLLNRPTNKRLIREDEAWILLSGLEMEYDAGLSAAVAKKTDAVPRAPSAKPAAILSRRTQWPVKSAESAENAKDAMAISLAETGGVSVPRMMALTGKPWAELRAELADLIYFDPADAIWREASDMLSGDVLTKIENAQRVLRAYGVATDGSADEQGAEQARVKAEMQHTLEALEAARPERKSFSEITPLPGAAWVPADIMNEFFKTVGGPSIGAIYTPSSGKWDFTGYGQGEAEFSTQRMSAKDILAHLWNGKPISVRDRTADGGSVINHEQTALAKQKADAITQRWFDFLSETPERMAALEETWNTIFNRRVRRVYDGAHLKLEGSSDAIVLRPHQKNGVWRALQESSTLFDHVVGAGKTYASVAAVMEARRMGRSKKALVVAPEKVIGQWRDAFAALYPGARVLMAEPEDMSAGKRQQFLAKAAYVDWDAIIMAHSSFGLIPADPDFEAQYTDDLIDLAKADLLANASDRLSRKQIEKKIKKLKARIEKIASTRKDVGMHFGMLGVDMLVTDESHKFKNVTYETQLKVSGLGNPEGSARANDMAMKVAHLQSSQGKVVFATGTPIANTLAEMYILHRYLAPDALKSQGLYSFDAWQRAYAQINSEFTFTLSGQFKEKTTLAKFVNLAGLLGTYQSFADTITREDMARLMEEAGQERIKIPEIRGGKPSIHTCPMSPAQRAIMGEQIDVDEITGHPIYPEGSILWRLDHLPKGPPQKGDDNILTIINHLRLVGLDARAFNPSAPAPEDGKLPRCAANIMTSWAAFKEDKGTQLVFLDLCTPKRGQSAKAQHILSLIEASESEDANAAEAADEELETIPKAEVDAAIRGSSAFDAYTALKNDLVSRGMPPEQIAFVHDYDTPAKFDRLTAAVNAGNVRVLIGSTAKIGAGVNVQKRITDIHHLSAPYTPAEIEQANGRGLRQGNELLEKYGADQFKLGIHYYVTEDSGDAGLWQILQTKLEFIEQIRSGNAGNEMVNPDAAAIDPGRVKAMASGNEILVEEVKLRDQIQKAERLLRAAKSDQLSAARSLESARQAMQYAQSRIEPARKLQEAAVLALEKAQKSKDALRQAIDAAHAEGKKHPAADAWDVISKEPIYEFTGLDGKTITTNLADIGARINLVASRSMSGAAGSRPVGAIFGVPISVKASYDFFSVPASLLGYVYLGHEGANVATRSINFSTREAEGAIGRAMWRLLATDAATAGDEAMKNVDRYAAEVERREAYANKPSSTTVSMDELNVMREQQQKAVLALRLGCRKWDQFEAKLAEHEARQAAKEAAKLKADVEADKSTADAPTHV